ncbi:hypothetical protein HDU67_005600 [Dinochytrium kinnereticum]|nr:hypothetical protein HDU67_005600 [Dinochytrium kinnereticum]
MHARQEMTASEAVASSQRLQGCNVQPVTNFFTFPMKLLQTLRWARALPTASRASLPRVQQRMGIMTASFATTTDAPRIHHRSCTSLLRLGIRMASTPSRMLNTSQDYDQFLARFLEIKHLDSKVVTPARLMAEDILAQKVKEGFKVTVRNLGVIAHLTLAPPDIRELLEAVSNKYNLEPDSAIFSKLIRNALHAGDPALACEILARAVKMPAFQWKHHPDLVKVWGLMSKDIISKLPVSTFSALIQAHINCRSGPKALDVYNAGKPKILAYLMKTSTTSEVVTEQMPGKASRPSKEQIERDRMTTSINNLILVNALTSPVTAKSLFDEVRSTGFVPSTEVYTALVRIIGYFRSNELPRLLEDMRRNNVPRNEKLYSSFASVLSKASISCDFVLDEMRQDGVVPTTYIYNGLLSALLKRGEIQKGRDLMETMKKEGIHPDTTTYNILLEGCLSRGKWDEADGLLSEMDAAGIKKDVVTVNTLISANARREGGDPRQGQVLFDTMLKPPANLRPNRNTYNGLLRCHLALKEWSQAESLIKSLEIHPSLTMRPDGRIYDTYLRSLAEESAASSQPAPLAAQIDRALTSMRSRGVSAQVSTLAALIRSAGKRRNIGDAKRYHSLLASQTLFSDSDSVNSAMITAFDACGDYVGAVRWADSTVPGSGTGDADVTTLKQAGKVVQIGRVSTYALMVAHARAKNEKLVNAVWEQLKRLEEGYVTASKERKGRAGYSVNEANAFIQAYNYLGNLEGAMTMWRTCFQIRASEAESEMVDNARMVKSSLPGVDLVDRYGVDRITVSLILDTVGMNGTLPALQALWSEIVQSRFPVDVNNWVSYLEGLARFGADKEVVDIIRGPAGLRSQVRVSEKVFWSVLPLIKDQECAKEIWGILMKDFPDLKEGVSGKIANYLAENAWLEP